MPLIDNFYQFNPQNLTTKDFITIGLPPLVAQPGSWENGEDYFQLDGLPQMYYEKLSFCDPQESTGPKLTITKLTLNDEPVQRDVFSTALQKLQAGNIGVFCECSDTTIGDKPALEVKNIPVTPVRQTAYYGLFCHSIYVYYFPGFNPSDSPANIFAQLKKIFTT